MRLLSRLPLAQRVALIILACCSAMIVLGGAALTGYELLDKRREGVARLEAQADLLSPSLAMALSVGDRTAAGVALGGLQYHRGVQHAWVLDRAGLVFAEYNAGGTAVSTAPVRAPEGVQVRGATVLVSRRLRLNGRQVGALCVEGRLVAWQAQAITYGMIAIGLMGVAIGLTALLAWWAQRFVSGPILALAAVARDVRHGGDYTRRFVTRREDELGQLAADLNHMLDRVRQQDAERRTSEARLRLMIASFPGLLWTTDSELRLISAAGGALAAAGQSPERLVGLSLADYYGTRDAGAVAIAAHRRALAGETVAYETTDRDRSYLSHVEPLRDAAGSIAGVLGAAIDLTTQKETERKLREALEFSRNVIAAAPIGIAVAQENGQFLYANEATARIVGATVDQLTALNFRQLASWQQSGLLALAEQALRDDRPVRDERPVRTSFGRELWLDLSFVPFHVGSQRQLLVMAADTTERHRAEIALRESEERYRTLVDAAEDIIFRLEPDGTISSLNPAFEVVLGWPRADWLGRSFRELVHPDDLPLADQRNGEVLAGGDPPNLDVRLRCRDGRHVTVEVAGVGERRDGQVVGVIGIARDLTQRRAAEGALREAQERLRNLYDSSTDAIVYVRMDGTFIEFNRAYETLTGYPRRELSRMSYQQLTPPEYREAEAEHVRRILATGQAARFEKQYLRADGSRVDVALTAFPVRGADGQIQALAAIVRDVTEEKRVQRELTEISDREQRRIGQDLHDGLSQHLVGTAFAVNMLAATLKAAGRPEAAEAHEVGELLNQAISQSRQLTRGLYPVQLETGGLAAALGELAQTVTRVYGVPCESAMAEHLEVTEPTVAGQLYRIAQEATHNAARHAGAQRIWIQLQRDGDRLVLLVGDDGRGFEPGDSHAAGMGLRIMRYRARLLGAQLEVHSRPGGGTRVRCSLSVPP